ncbi:hypothetical protein Tco_0188988 [Tanacetum coccineum]
MSNTNTNLQTQTSSVLQNDTVSSCSISKVQEKTQLSRRGCMSSLRAIKTTFENAFNSEFKERMQKYTRFDAQSFKDAMICNMDSIGKYMLEIILHQQRTLYWLKQKQLMQTQKDHSNPIQALNIDSLKVDLVVIQNTCSEKEDTNSKTASSKLVKECSLNLNTRCSCITIKDVKNSSVKDATAGMVQPLPSFNGFQVAHVCVVSDSKDITSSSSIVPAAIGSVVIYGSDILHHQHRIFP